MRRPVKPSDKFGNLRSLGKLKPCPLAELASAYGVKVFIGSWPREVSYKNGYQEGSWYFGGQGGGYNSVLRQVYVASDHDYAGDDDARVQHEFSHLICAIPFLRHWEFPEETGLLQWEETLVDRFGFDRENYQYYLDLTRVTSEQKRFWKDIRNPYRKKWWIAGKGLAERVGLIDGNGESTMLWPDWSKLSDKDRKMMETWVKRGVI